MAAAAQRSVGASTGSGLSMASPAQPQGIGREGHQPAGTSFTLVK